MDKRWRALLAVWAAWAVLAAAGAILPVAAAVELTAMERRWLEASLPVLQFAREQGLPLDILVQPQPTPGETPIGMAIVDGRCKLVLSMRGNPGAQDLLDHIAPGLRGPVVEAIAAHELAHCWRHQRQLWGTLPAGMEDSRWRSRVSPEQAQLLDEMWRTRREEAFADLVALAWTLERHPTRYADVQLWYSAVRARQDVDTGPHDTRLWVQLAQDPGGFAPAPLLFDRVMPLWVAGLRSGVPGVVSAPRDTGVAEGFTPSSAAAAR